MRYPTFRRQHHFVGSSVIEAGCKTVIGSRLKLRHILDGKRRQRHHRPAMLPAQQPLRRLLGGAPPGCLISTSTSQTLARPLATALSLRARHGSEFDSGKNRRVLCHFTSSLYPFPSVHCTSSNRPSACK